MGPDQVSRSWGFEGTTVVQPMKSEAVRPRDQEAQCGAAGELQGRDGQPGNWRLCLCTSDRPEFKF